MKTPTEVASLVSMAMNNETRGRLSELSVVEAAEVVEVTGVRKLDPHWVVAWIAACAVQGLLVGQLARGGFGVLRTEALSGAKPINL
jgi:hypothetical protein